MGTTNQKPVTDTQNIKRKKYKHYTKESHQITRDRAESNQKGETLHMLKKKS